MLLLLGHDLVDVGDDVAELLVLNVAGLGLIGAGKKRDLFNRSGFNRFKEKKIPVVCLCLFPILNKNQRKFGEAPVPEESLR